MKRIDSGWDIILLALLIGIAALVPAMPAAGIENNFGYQAVIDYPEILPINQSEINETALEPYQKTPEPITLFKAEVRETSLPGPRYMAFGPSFIGISVSPIFIALTVLIFLGIAAWGIWMYRKSQNEREM